MQNASEKNGQVIHKCFLSWALAASSNYIMPKIFPNGPMENIT